MYALHIALNTKLDFELSYCAICLTIDTKRAFVYRNCCSKNTLICSAHAGYIGTDRSLLTGHDALLLRQIARDLLHALSACYQLVPPVPMTGSPRAVHVHHVCVIMHVEDP